MTIFPFDKLLLQLKDRMNSIPDSWKERSMNQRKSKKIYFLFLLLRLEIYNVQMLRTINKFETVTLDAPLLVQRMNNLSYLVLYCMSHLGLVLFHVINSIQPNQQINLHTFSHL